MTYQLNKKNKVQNIHDKMQEKVSSHTETDASIPICFEEAESEKRQ